MRTSTSFHGALMIAFCFLSRCAIVPGNEPYIIERFGEFKQGAVREQNPSLIPFVDPYRRQKPLMRQPAQH